MAMLYPCKCGNVVREYTGAEQHSFHFIHYRDFDAALEAEDPVIELVETDVFIVECPKCNRLMRFGGESDIATFYEKEGPRKARAVPNTDATSPPNSDDA